MVYFCNHILNLGYNDLFFTKAKNWEYEKEWRMLNEEGDKELPVPGEISGIIFGLRMPDEQKETIKNILINKNNIKYFQTFKVENRYELEIKETE